MTLMREVKKMAFSFLLEKRKLIINDASGVIKMT